jgi:hypothetical protein
MKPLVASSSPRDSETQHCCQMELCSAKKNREYNIREQYDTKQQKSSYPCQYCHKSNLGRGMIL